MLQLGKHNTLRVKRIRPKGVYLEGNDTVGDILLPNRYVPEGTKVGDRIRVFIYLDHEERLVATTEHPLIEVGQFAFLQCKWINQYGAYMDWGLMKDLFCPFREQKVKMEVGKRYQVYCYIDDITYRIVCTSRIDRLMQAPQKQEEAPHSPLPSTDRTVMISDFTPRLLRYLRDHDGKCPYHDHSSAEDIYAEFSVSKKIFKQAVGNLYKQQIIRINPDGLELV